MKLEYNCINRMFHIITFGSATRDIFVDIDSRFPIGDFKPDNIKKEILVPYGYKIDVKDIHSYSGGGGTNTAATFALQGLKTAYCGMVGNDSEGDIIIRELQQRKIGTGFVVKNKKKPSDLSVILTMPAERTILTYHGASRELQKKDIHWKALKNTEWFYIAGLSGKSAEIFRSLVAFAKKNHIQVMANPHVSWFKSELSVIRPILKDIDILIVNLEEAQHLAKNYDLAGKVLIKEIKKFFPGVLIITNGREKAYLSDSKNLYGLLPPKIKIVDSTGAGDAFGSGYLAGWVKTNIVEKSLQFGLSNSVACLLKWGAKTGLLSKNQKLLKVSIKKEKL